MIKKIKKSHDLIIAFDACRQTGTKYFERISGKNYFKLKELKRRPKTPRFNNIYETDDGPNYTGDSGIKLIKLYNHPLKKTHEKNN